MKEGFECSIKSEISYFYINLLKKKKTTSTYRENIIEVRSNLRTDFAT